MRRGAQLKNGKYKMKNEVPPLHYFRTRAGKKSIVSTSLLYARANFPNLMNACLNWLRGPQSTRICWRGSISAGKQQDRSWFSFISLLKIAWDKTIEHLRRKASMISGDIRILQVSLRDSHEREMLSWIHLGILPHHQQLPLFIISSIVSQIYPALHQNEQWRHISLLKQFFWITNETQESMVNHK